MKKPSKMKRLNILGFTLVVLVVPFALYYLFYVTSQQAYFTNRNFRVLAGISRQLKSKVENLGGSLKNAAVKASNELPKTTTEPRSTRSVDERLKRAVDLIRGSGTDVRYKAGSAAQIQQAPLTQARPLPNAAQASKGPPSTPPPPPAPNSAPEPKRAPLPTKAAPAPADPTVSMRVTPEHHLLRFYIEYPGAKDGRPTRPHFEIAADKLFEPFVIRYIYNDIANHLESDRINQAHEYLFDEVLVAEHQTGKVLFELGRPELKIVSLDSFVGVDGKTIEQKLADQSTTLLDITLAGTDYKFFLQPVLLSLPDVQTGEPIRWVVCGLTRTDRFRDETFSVSYTMLIAFGCLVLLLSLCWPLIKLGLMGPKDRFHSADVLVTVLFGLLGTGVLSLVLLDAYTYTRLEKRLDGQLQSLATQISSNLTEELGSALKQLRRLNKGLLRETQTASSGPLKDLKDSIGKTGAPETAPNGRKASTAGAVNIMGDKLDVTAAPYPFFNTAFWVDPSGMQRIKWTTRSETTPFISVADRGYFARAKEADLWSMRAGNTIYDFTLEPINSRNTGQNLAIISTTVPGSQWVTGIDLRLLSLMEAVLPAGYGYAIIEDNGRVLFHFDEIKNLDEEFFAECGFDRLLRSAVMGRTSELIDAQYLGRGHRLFVTPLPNLPWTLVVFRDKQIVRTANLELITLSLLLFVPHAFIIFLIGALIFLPRSRNRAERLWPDSGKEIRYKTLIVVNLVLAAVGLLYVWNSNGWPVVVSAVALPVLGIGVTVWLLGDRPTSRRLWTLLDNGNTGTKKTYRRWYVLAFASLAVLAAVMPAFSFFSIARDLEVDVLVRYGQLSLAEGLQIREERILKTYEFVKMGKQDELRNLFLARRLDPRWDVYSSFFFGTQQVPEPESPDLADGPADGSLRRFLTDLSPLYNQTSIEKHGLAREASADRLWQWSRPGGNELMLVKREAASADAHKIGLSSRLPAFVAPGEIIWWIQLVVGLVLVGSAVYFVTRFLARRILLIDLENPSPLSINQISSAPIKENLLVIRPPLTVNGSQWNDQRYYRLDLRQAATDDHWADTIEFFGIPPGRAVVIENFDHGMNDGSANLQKLRFLEYLAAEARPVVIVSASDPSTFSFEPVPNSNPPAGPTVTQPVVAGVAAAQQNGNVQVTTSASESNGAPAAATRWASALNSIAKVYAIEDTDGSVEEERLRFYKTLRAGRRPWAYLGKLFDRLAGYCTNDWRDEEIISHVVDQAAPYYQAIWNSCSCEEKLALFHLAEDRLISSKSTELRELMKRGLVIRDPELRLVDEAFRRFVMSAGMKEDLPAFEHQVKMSNWGLLKGPLLMLLAGAAIFLFATQKELYDSTMTFISALTVGLAALIKLFGMFQRDKTPVSTDST